MCSSYYVLTSGSILKRLFNRYLVIKSVPLTMGSICSKQNFVLSSVA